jgi:hypothetical protein
MPGIFIMRTSIPLTLTPYIREAIIIHVCAFAAAGLYALIETAAYQSPELVALRGVSFAAATALYLWSLYLTARSCHDHEALKPIVILTTTVLLELMVFSLALLKEEPSHVPSSFFEHVDYYGVAFYAVFFITLTFLAAPLAWHCARLEKPVHDSPDAYALINRALEIHALFMLLLTAVLLPPALFLYCVSSTELEQPKSWRQEYLEICPDFVRDHTADILSLLNSNFYQSLHLRILENGWASTEHLESQLTAEPTFELAALKGLLNRPADVALPVALGISANRYYSGGEYIHRAVGILMNNFREEQIRAFLNPDASLALQFRKAFIYEIRKRGLEQYIGDLKTLAMDGNNYEAAMATLATLLPKNEFDELWTIYLCNSDEVMRRRAIHILYMFHGDPHQFMLQCLDRSSPEIAASLLKYFKEPVAVQYHHLVKNDAWMKRMTEYSMSIHENLRRQADEWLGKNVKENAFRRTPITTNAGTKKSLSQSAE